MWSTKLQGSIAVSPIVIETQFNIFLATTRGHCYCLDQLTGTIKWEYRSEEPIFGSAVKNTNGGVIFPTVRNHLMCLSFQNGQVIWKFKAGGPIFSSIICHENHLIFGCHDKHLYVVKPSADSCCLIDKVKVASEISASAFVYSELNNTFIVASCNAGIIYVIDFKTRGIVKELRLPDEIFSSPVVSERKLFVGCRDNYLYCININETLLNF